MATKNPYEEIFNTEMEGWCYGVTHFSGEISPALIHRIVKELSASFKVAIDRCLVFNVLDLAAKFSKAAKYLVPESEIAFSILVQLPNPAVLSEESQLVLAQVVDQVEQAYGGALEPLQKKWNWERERMQKAKAA